MLFVLGKGRGYYLGAAYPMLMAMGAVMGERWLASISGLSRRAIEVAVLSRLVACGVYISAIVVPVASAGALQRFRIEEQRRSARRNRLG